MALKVELKPRERIIIGQVVIVAVVFDVLYRKFTGDR